MVAKNERKQTELLRDLDLATAELIRKLTSDSSVSISELSKTYYNNQNYPQVRKVAIEAIGKRNEKGAGKLLEAALKDPDKGVRGAARAALQNYGMRNMAVEKMGKLKTKPSNLRQPSQTLKTIVR